MILVDNVYRQHHTGLQSLLDAELPFFLLRVHRGALMDDAVAALEKAEVRLFLSLSPRSCLASTLDIHISMRV